MRAIVLYETMTGTTARAAELIGGRLQQAGLEIVGLSPLKAIDMEALSHADLVILGSWTDGFVAFGQRPGRAGLFKALPSMAGKTVAAYCTYAVDPGKTVAKMCRYADATGAHVVGGLALHRKRLDQDTADFTERLLGAVRV